MSPFTQSVLVNTTVFQHRRIPDISCPGTTLVILYRFCLGFVFVLLGFVGWFFLVVGRGRGTLFGWGFFVHSKITRNPLMKPVFPF